MSIDQITIFSIIILSIILFIWERWRYDLVALLALFLSVVSGIVKPEKAFTGLADPVVTTVACILIISAAISRSGFIDWSMKIMSRVIDKPKLQVITLAGLVIVLSAFMNNVGALAVFLPIAIASARKAERSPSELLMPLSFGSLLGGLITLIGTPPNILISSIRQQMTGESYSMFDFAPVGLGVAAVGLIYLAIGWKLIPKRHAQAKAEERFVIEDYISEVVIPAESPFIGKTVGDLESSIEGDFAIVGFIRNQHRRLVPSSRQMLKEGDVLIVESDPVVLKNLVDTAKLALVGSGELKDNPLTSDEVGVVEAVIMAGSEMIRATPRMLSLRSRFGVNLLAVRQNGTRSTQRLGFTQLREGDIVVLQGNIEMMDETLRELGCLPLAERKLLLGRDKPRLLPVAIMAVAVALATFNAMPIAMAFFGAVLVIGFLRILRLNEMYEAIDAPVIVLLAAMMPVTDALQATGGTELISQWIAGLTQGFGPASIIAFILVVSMLVTPFLNNAAAVLLMAPIAASLAGKLGMSIDPFLMAVAVGTSCDFLTPIGHQSNTLVMGPGGYKFGDYWRMGLPLSIIVVFTATPLILMFWPLYP